MTMNQRGRHSYEPLTPMGRLCLRPEHNHVIHVAIQFKNPINIDALKKDISSSVLVQIPRFSSLRVEDLRDGSEIWKPTRINIDDHIIIHHHDDDYDDHYGHHDHGMSDDDIINSYLADIAIAPPMSLDKPLWEVHVMPDQKCMVMRVHHALADGTSLMSLLWTMGRSQKIRTTLSSEILSQIDNTHLKEKMIMHNNNDGKSGNRERSSPKKMGLWEWMVYIWFSFVYGLKFLAKCLWMKDHGKISGIEGVELWPRKVATATFSIEDMKTIKKAIPNATVHDVLYGIVWSGLTRYLSARHPQDFRNGAQFTCMCPFNLRERPGLQDVSTMLKNSKVGWGNKFSIILLPITYYTEGHDMNPLDYVAKAKSVMERQKQSMEARFSYNVVSMGAKLFGPKVAGFAYYKLFCNTTFLLSNIVGPQEEISIAGNPVTSLRLTSSGQPQALTMHLVSYMGRANLQVQVAKYVIPDPEFLAQCFENSLHDMKKAAENVAQTPLPIHHPPKWTSLISPMHQSNSHP